MNIYIILLFFYYHLIFLHYTTYIGDQSKTHIVFMNNWNLFAFLVFLLVSIKTCSAQTTAPAQTTATIRYCDYSLNNLDGNDKGIIGGLVAGAFVVGMILGAILGVNFQRCSRREALQGISEDEAAKNGRFTAGARLGYKVISCNIQRP